MKTLSICAAVLTMLLVAPSTSAIAAVAVLEHLTGNPTIYEVGEHGARAASLPRRDAEYTLPIEIETGPQDSATFRLPDSEVSVAPNTVMRVAAPEFQRGGLLQRIFQKAGSSLFSVNRREVEHFQVETPFLVSVVKGTTFNVVVHQAGATVSLHEGRLQVNSVDGTQQVELAPGDVAYASRDGSLEMLQSTLVHENAAATPAAESNPDYASDPPGSGDVADLQETVSDEVAMLGSDVGADSGSLSLEGADDLVTEVGDSGGDLVTDVEDTTDDLVTDLGETAEDLATDVGDSGDDLVTDVGDTAGGLITDVGETADDLVTDVGDTSEDLVTDLGETADDLAGTVTEEDGDLGETVEDVTEDLGGDLLGGLYGGEDGDGDGDFGESEED